MILAAQGPQMCNPTHVGRSTAMSLNGPDTAAGLCAGVPDVAWAAVRLVWAIDARDAAQLERLLYLAAVELSIANAWPQPPRGSTRIRRMVHIALLERANPRSIWVDGPRGKVNRAWTHGLRAELLGMLESSYVRRWAPCYEQVYRHLDEWVALASRRIRQNIAAGEIAENA